MAETKQKTNFACVLDYLRKTGRVKNQKDLAEKIGSTETTVSRNKTGESKTPDEETLCNFNRAFGDIINIDFLRGKSDIMLVKDLPDAETLHDFTPTYNDYVTLVNTVIAAKEETIASLKRELAAKEKQISMLEQQLYELQVEKGLSAGRHQRGVVEQDSV